MTRARFLAAFFVLGAAVPALPCSIAVEPHRLDPAEKAIDVSAPVPPSVVLAAVERGRAPAARPDGSVTASSCDDIGMIRLTVSGAADDRTRAEELGYAVVVTSGEPPEGLQPAEAVRAPGGELLLHWIDGATDDQEPLDFTLTVMTVDLAGNRSAASPPVRVRHRMAKR